MPTPERRPRLFAPLDLLVALVVVAAGAAALPLVEHHTPRSVAVYRDNNQIATYPLDTPATFTVQGALGPVELRIEDGAVRITRSECRRQICVRTGPIRRPGRQLVCVPNHLVVRILTRRNEYPESPDAVTE